VTYQETVASEVASRYGCAVSPSCVQIIPRGISGLPDPGTPGLHWREATRRSLAAFHHGQRVRKAAEEPAPVKPRETEEARLARLRASCAKAHAKRLEMSAVERQARLSALAKTVPLADSIRDAADALGICYSTAVKLCREAGIKPAGRKVAP
jgi:hypothetical protein